MAVGRAEAGRLASAFTRLVSPETCADPEEWRVMAARTLRELVGADAACIAVEGAASAFQALDLGPEVMRAYQAHYVLVDHGIARQRATGTRVWTRQMLWRPEELARSEYFNDFAEPHGLLDAAGVATFASGHGVRVSLLFSQGARSARGAAAFRRQVALLYPVWPAFNAGAALSARWQMWQGSLARVVDRVPQPIALLAASGRVLHQNAALERAIAAGPGDELTAAMRSAAQAVASVATGRSPSDALVRDFSAPVGSWRVVGSPLECELGGTSPTVLVSLVAAAGSAPPAASLCEVYRALRTRFGLTSRQIEVLDLLRDRRSNAEVAATLGISEHTARHHTESVFAKLGIHSRAGVADELEALAARMGRSVHGDSCTSAVEEPIGRARAPLAD